MQKCPNCNEPSISLSDKVSLERGRSVNCSSCGYHLKMVKPWRTIGAISTSLFVLYLIFFIAVMGANIILAVVIAIVFHYLGHGLVIYVSKLE